jgi:Na+-transporting NADH:ubiquinone oxidoreductase subunit NqrB
MLLGALLGLAVAGLGSVFDYSLASNDGLFWGAVVGGVLAGMPQFALAGAVLTRSENRAWNTLVGVVASMLLLGVILLLVVLLARLFS